MKLVFKIVLSILVIYVFLGWSFDILGRVDVLHFDFPFPSKMSFLILVLQIFLFLQLIKYARRTSLVIFTFGLWFLFPLGAMVVLWRVIPLEK